MALTLVKKAGISRYDFKSQSEFRNSQLARIGRLLYKLFWFSRCWHRKMSRPFTRDGRTFRVCLRCGIHQDFDLENWKSTGSYYYERVSSAHRELSTTKGTRQ